MDKQSKNIVVSVSPSHIERLDEYVATGKKFSRSEAVRYCIDLAFEKDFPDYVRAINDRKKEKDVKAKMTNEEYCNQIMGGFVEGELCVLRKPNGLEMTWPIEKIKEFSEKDTHL